MRTWSAAEENAYSSISSRTHVKVEVANSSDVLQNWTDIDGSGTSLVTAIEWGDSLDAAMGDGQATIVWRRTEHDNISPFVTGGRLSGWLDVWRRIVISTKVVPPGADPASFSWNEVFRGRIDDFDLSTNPGKITFRDQIGSELMDQFIMANTRYGDSSGGTVDIEDAAASILSDWDNEGNTLVVPNASNLQLKTYTQQQMPILQALKNIFFTAGWDCRPKWNDTASAFRLTAYAPSRSPGPYDHAFTKNDVSSYGSFSFALENVRNWVKVYYGDAANEDDLRNDTRTHVERLDATNPAHNPANPVVLQSSIDRYGYRPMIIGEASTSIIQTQQEAENLADFALLDLADPTLLAGVELKYYWWPIELNDYLRFTADGQRFDTDTDLAVNSYRHLLDVNARQGITRITLQGKPRLGVEEWLRRESRPGQGPPWDDLGPEVPELTVTERLMSVDIEVIVPKEADYDQIIFYEGPWSGFTANRTTVVQAGRSKKFTRIKEPGERAYFKVRVRDKFGNYSDPASAVVGQAKRFSIGNFDPRDQTFIQQKSFADLTITTFGQPLAFTNISRITSGDSWDGFRMFSKQGGTYNFQGAVDLDITMETDWNICLIRNPDTENVEVLSGQVNRTGGGGGGVTTPVVEDRTETAQGTSQTNQPVDMPSTVNAGDLLIVIMGLDDDTNSAPVGWTQIVDNWQSDTNQRTEVFAKKATGDEGGTSPTWTTSTIARMCAHTIRIQAGTWADSGSIASDVKVSAEVTGVLSTSPDPDPVALHSGGDNLVIAFTGFDGSSNSVSSYPSGYGNGDHQATTGENVASCWKTVTGGASSENPGAFTIANSVDWGAGALAIGPNISSSSSGLSYATWSGQVVADPGDVFEYQFCGTGSTGSPKVLAGAQSSISKITDSTRSTRTTDGDTASVAYVDPYFPKPTSGGVVEGPSIHAIDVDNQGRFLIASFKGAQSVGVPEYVLAEVTSEGRLIEIQKRSPAIAGNDHDQTAAHCSGNRYYIGFADLDTVAAVEGPGFECFDRNGDVLYTKTQITSTSTHRVRGIAARESDNKAWVVTDEGTAGKIRRYSSTGTLEETSADLGNPLGFCCLVEDGQMLAVVELATTGTVFHLYDPDDLAAGAVWSKDAIDFHDEWGRILASPDGRYIGYVGGGGRSSTTGENRFRRWEAQGDQMLTFLMTSYTTLPGVHGVSGMHWNPNGDIDIVCNYYDGANCLQDIVRVYMTYEEDLDAGTKNLSQISKVFSLCELLGVDSLNDWLDITDEPVTVCASNGDCILIGLQDDHVGSDGAAAVWPIRVYSEVPTDLPKSARDGVELPVYDINPQEWGYEDGTPLAFIIAEDQTGQNAVIKTVQPTSGNRPSTNYGPDNTIPFTSVTFDGLTDYLKGNVEWEPGSGANPSFAFLLLFEPTSVAQYEGPLSAVPDGGSVDSPAFTLEFGADPDDELLFRMNDDAGANEHQFSITGLDDRMLDGVHVVAVATNEGMWFDDTDWDDTPSPSGNDYPTNPAEIYLGQAGHTTGNGGAFFEGHIYRLIIWGTEDNATGDSLGGAGYAAKRELRRFIHWIKAVYDSDLGYNPDNTTNMVYWVDTSDISTMWTDTAKTTQVAALNDEIQAIDDKSGNAQHFEYTGTAPVYEPTGFNSAYPTAYFSNTNDSWYSPSATDATPMTVFGVIDNDDTGACYATWSTGGLGTRVSLATDAATGTGPGFYDGAHKAFGSTTVTSPAIWEAVYEAGGTARLYINGVEHGSGTAYTSWSNTGGNFRIGGNAPIERISEIRQYNIELSANRRKAIREHLASKWGVTL